MDASVLDVSACMPWCCEDETTDASEQVLDFGISGSLLHVPALWTWEILNAVAVVIKRRRISAERGKESLEQLSAFDSRIELPPKIADFAPLHTLADSHGLTAYDTAYLDLAQRLAVPLASRDRDLIRAAQARGVTIV